MWPNIHDIATYCKISRYLKISQAIAAASEKLQKLLAASARASASHSAMTSLTSRQVARSEKPTSIYMYIIYTYIHTYIHIYIYWITSAIHSKVCQCCFKFSCDYCQDSLPNKQWSWRKSRMFQLFFGSLRPFWPRLSWCVSWRRCWPLSSKRLAASRSFWQSSHDKLPQIIWKLQE